MNINIIVIMICLNLIIFSNIALASDASDLAADEASSTEFQDAVATENANGNSLSSVGDGAITSGGTMANPVGTSTVDGRDAGLNAITTSTTVSKKYKLLETIGSNEAKTSVTFPTYVKNLYKFAIGFVSIAALLMITIGGFSYMTAAGNQSQVSTAKKLIVDAILGLIVVFVSWLVLNTINPDLLNTTIPGLRKLQNSVNQQTGITTTPSGADGLSSDGLGGKR